MVMSQTSQRVYMRPILDLSNLNRQFLFKKKGVKQSKVIIAAQTAAPFNPSVHIHPIYNITEPEFDVEWFEGLILCLMWGIVWVRTFWFVRIVQWGVLI